MNDLLECKTSKWRLHYVHVMVQIQIEYVSLKTRIGHISSVAGLLFALDRPSDSLLPNMYISKILI